jgi:uncharacterized glyoxalase superfamily protein PhnB
VAEKHPNSVHLTVADPERSIRFYEGLGFEFTRGWPDKEAPLWAALLLDEQCLMVGKLLSSKKLSDLGASKQELRQNKKEIKAFKKHRAGVGVQLYFQVSDVDRHCKQAKRRKIELVTPLKTQFYGIRDYSVDDPDGYRLVFYSPVEQAERVRTIRPKRKARRTVKRKSPAPAVEELDASPAVAGAGVQ